MKIRDRLYAICFLSCVVPMTFMGIFINSIVSSELKKEEEYKIKTTLHSVNEYLGKLIVDVNNSVDSINYILDSHRGDEMNEYLMGQMQIYGEMREEVEGYYYGDPDGRFFSGWPRTQEELDDIIANDYIRENYDPRTRPWYQLARENEGLVISDPYVDAFDESVVITASKRVERSDSFIGAIGVDFNFYPINQELYRLKPWETGGFLITTNKGELLIDASTLEDFYTNNESIIKSGKLGEHKSLENEDILFQVIPLDHFNFKLIGVYSEKEIYNSLSNIRKTVFITMVISLIFSAVVIAIFGRKLSNSMDRLSYLINSIARGNYTKNIDKLSAIIDDRSELYLVKEAVKNMQHQIKSRELQLKNIAEVDGLTGTLNRKAFLDIMGMELQRTISFSTEFSIIMFDYDKFKDINDSYGHLFGDTVLMEVSEYIKHSLKEDDFIGRYGGEEFIILLPGTPLEDAVRVGERLRKTIENMVWETGTTVTISCGIIQVAGEKSIEELIKRADDLLYKAKNNGRNRIEY